MNNKIPTQLDNPNGLHQRYQITKLIRVDESWRGIKTKPKIVRVPIDPEAEYFVFRLDEKGKDPNHIKACRIGIHAYADAIEPHIPQLAKELKERYPLL